MNRNHEIAPGGTLKDLKTGETMHSSIGAWEEANALYAGQSELSRNHGPLVVYDIGMGVAANAIALLTALQGAWRPVHLVSFENDPSGLAFALENFDAFPYLRGWEGVLERLLREKVIRGADLTWELHVGDFAELDLNPLPLADLVYFDFYSPKVSGPLWSVEIFEKVREACSKDARLITYSSATHARVAMLLAGFYVGPGLSTSAKSETTLATTKKDALSTHLGADWLAKLERSSRVVPFGWEEARKDEVLQRLRSHPQF